MSRVYASDKAELYHGDAREQMRLLTGGPYQAIITSPPYWGLRAYNGTPSAWGGDNHAHAWNSEEIRVQSGGEGPASKKQVTNTGSQDAKRNISRATCDYCDAWYGELGHEPTIKAYIEHLVEVFRVARTVLRDNGLLFVNLGDSYGGPGRGPSSKNGLSKQHSNTGSLATGALKTDEIKPKDLCLIPERFALAMQDDGWYIRSRIAWCKKSPMTESVSDRPTSAWEHIWMFSKSRTYYYNVTESAEPAVKSGEYRHMWNYWIVGPDPYRGAHYATFPKEIVRRCLRMSTKPGDVILDPFVGSGRAIATAISMGRSGDGIDSNLDYLLRDAIPQIEAAV